jgi:hypothetical protein
MHQLCITCHQKCLTESPEQLSNKLDRCDYCHDEDRLPELELMLPGRAAKDEGRNEKEL